MDALAAGRDRVSSPEILVDRLLAFLEAVGRSVDDDECVTQLDHALQTAALAAAAGAGDALQAAALLHDIGHLLVDADASVVRPVPAALRHEVVGARLLEAWFGPAVAGPVRLHVSAKRALVATDPRYAVSLSAPSTRSLAAQGGPMVGAELERFMALEHAGPALVLRRWDDGAKVPDAAVPGLDAWRPVLLRCARRRP